VSSRTTPVALTIAGSDSGGGAGIQADLKAFARCGVHGTSAITAITAQNTATVSAVHAVPPGIIAEQVKAVVDDIGVDAVKIGMLGAVETIEAVAAALELVGDAPVVVDPVMVAESGARLLDEDAVSALIDLVLARAAVATPNIPEARALTGAPADAGQEDLARRVIALGPRAVVVTGGHTEDGTDLLAEGDREPVWILGGRHPDGAAHGSGCTHASALAAGLARGMSIADSARLAKAVAAEAVGQGLRDLGAGAGPVDALAIAARRQPE
jgi:hydroxymethylpyrimidine/phosphomethylpyrimidine kinase